jgi:hypothetical protein
MNNALCRHCMTPIDFGIEECGCDGERIEQLEAENQRLCEALVQIRGWREIGHADTIGEKLRAIEAICDRALTNTQGPQEGE